MWSTWEALTRIKRGPVAPAVERPNYRMLAAIIETGGAGNYFLKFYGPEKTVAANEKSICRDGRGTSKSNRPT